MEPRRRQPGSFFPVRYQGLAFGACSLGSARALWDSDPIFAVFMLFAAGVFVGVAIALFAFEKVQREVRGVGDAPAGSPEKAAAMERLEAAAKKYLESMPLLVAIAIAVFAAIVQIGTAILDK